MSIAVRVYVREDGRAPYAEWFGSLDPAVASRVQQALVRMELGNFGDWKAVGGGVSERRISFGPGYRIYFARDGNTLVILLGGGSKKRQTEDIENSKRLWAEYKTRKHGGDL